MSKLTQKQISYVTKRITEIEADKIAELSKKHTRKSVVLSFPERIKALRDGKFTLKEYTFKNYTPSNILEYVDFDDEVTGGRDMEAFAKDRKRISKEATRIRDSLILGSQEEALKAIEEFQNF